MPHFRGKSVLKSPSKKQSPSPVIQYSITYSHNLSLNSLRSIV